MPALFVTSSQIAGGRQPPHLPDTRRHQGAVLTSRNPLSYQRWSGTLRLLR
jgi:hypothetical protein